MSCRSRFFGCGQFQGKPPSNALSRQSAGQLVILQPRLLQMGSRVDSPPGINAILSNYTPDIVRTPEKISSSVSGNRFLKSVNTLRSLEGMISLVFYSFPTLAGPYPYCGRPFSHFPPPISNTENNTQI